MIPQETVQQIIQAADVVEVVGDYVSLKKRGANLIACCPFHNEKTPSFYVSPTKQLYKCFGCGKAGDSVRFVMEIDGLSYPEALRVLAKKYGIEIKEKPITDEELAAQNERESLFIVHEFAKNFYQQQLFESEEGKTIGLSYFKERGFNQHTLKTFELGYSPDTWDAFTKHALKSGFSLPILEKAGLTIIREEKEPIDRFRGRVMFPIHSVSGKTIAFGARILKNDPKTAKYLNSPETDIYHKSHSLYGISLAKNAIRQTDSCYLVEGYTDVISLHQAGIQQVVASSGTSLTKEQVQLIRRYTQQITILYDGDAAGIKASLRGVDLILEEGLDVKIVVFPENNDPDSYLRQVGSQAFKDYIATHQRDFIQFKTEISLADVGNDPTKRANLIADLVHTIARLPDAIKRAVFTSEVAKLLQIGEDILLAEVNKLIKKNATAKQKPAAANSVTLDANTQLPVQASEQNINIALPATEAERTKLSYQEEECTRLLVCYGTHAIERNVVEGYDITVADYIFAELKEMEFVDKAFGKIYQIFKEFYGRNEIPTYQYFVTHLEDDIRTMAINWLAEKHELSPNWRKFEIFVPELTEQKELAESVFRNIIRLKKARYEADTEALLEELSTAASPEEEALILQRIMRYKEVIKQLAAELGTVVQ